MATVALALGLLGLGAPAAAAAPREFYGVIAHEDPTAAEFDRMGAGKVGTYRTNLSWSAIQPQEPLPGLEESSYDWGLYDSLFENAARNGIRVLPTIYSSPRWAAPSAKQPPDAAHRDEFERWLRAAVERYGAGGSFWAENPSLPELPVEDWQLWNEQNSPVFWGPNPSAKSYLQLLLPAERAIHGADPSAKVVLGGFFPRPRFRGAVTLRAFLSRLYRLGAKDKFDAMAVHPYQLTPRRALKSVDRARAVMRRFRDGRTPIWITEVGWASSGIRTPVTVKPRVQARYLRRTFKLAARTRKRRRIEGVVWFSFKDLQQRYWIYRTGLFTAAGQPKPSWRAFVRLTGGRP